MSATIDVRKFTDYFAPTLNGDQAVSIVVLKPLAIQRRIEYLPEPCADYGVAVVDRCLQRLAEPPLPGNILVFAPDQEACEYVMGALIKALRRANISSEVCILYETLSPQQIESALQPTTHTKIIVSTDIAETGLTISGLGCVIDIGLSMQASYDPRFSEERLLVTAIDKATAEQRAGRVGRYKPGIVYRLYTKATYDSKDDHPIPLILREPFKGTLLRCLSTDPDAQTRFKLPELLGTRPVKPLNRLLTEPTDLPHPGTRLRAVDALKLLGALGLGLRLTDYGLLMSRLPVQPHVSH